MRPHSNEREVTVNFKMRENSLFAILLRSPYWISFLIAGALGVVASMTLPRQYASMGAFAGGPFFIIGVIAAWKQLRGISPARASKLIDEINRMAWPAFADAIEESFKLEGYAVTRCAGAGADFEVEKSQRRTMVSCKRWKAARHGVEPLRELQAAAAERGAECVYMATGEVTENARRFAAENGIDLMQGARLAQFLRKAVALKK